MYIKTSKNRNRGCEKSGNRTHNRTRGCENMTTQSVTNIVYIRVSLLHTATVLYLALIEGGSLYHSFIYILISAGAVEWYPECFANILLHKAPVKMTWALVLFVICREFV